MAATGARSVDSPLSGSVVVSKRETAEKGEKKVMEYRYGWGRFTPDCLQRLHRPEFLLLCMSALLILQGFVLNGILPASISHLERRFHFSSAEIGAFSSVYDIGVALMLIPISHYGSHGHKGRWMAWGALMSGLGSVTCSLPHFLVGKYQYGIPEPDQYCQADPISTNWTSLDATIQPYNHSSHCQQITGMSNWRYLFYVGYFLVGIGSSPLFTIAIAYLDENVSQKSSSTYMGIYSANVIIGPCLGYAAASFLAKVYGDFDKVDISTVPMTSEDTRWYGAWWVGVISAGFVICLLAIPLFGFGHQLPGSDKLREQDENEAHHGAASLHVSLSIANWSNFKHRVKVIMRNPTYVGLIMDEIATVFIVGGFAMFSTKYLETQYSMTTSSAAVAAAATAIPPALLGTVIGTFIQRRLQLKCIGNLIFSIVSTAMATVLWLSFYITCPTRSFGGVTGLPVHPNDTMHQDEYFTQHGGDLCEACNAHCQCSLSRFEPVCLAGTVSYFSKCHAGCAPLDLLNRTECACMGNGTMVDGMCPSDCTNNTLLTFMGLLGLLVFFVYLKRNPLQQALLRCVPFHLRTLALAFGNIPVRLFGCIPSNPVTGVILNGACLVWQQECGVKEVCVLYDNTSLASYLQLTGVIGFSVAYVALVFAWKRYIPPPTEYSPPSSDRSVIQEAIRSSWREPVMEP